VETCKYPHGTFQNFFYGLFMVICIKGH
jgi:hypothetical protein